ncbi:MAG: biopolymer transporter ExbD [Verrucomicrobiota bacterium]
MIRLRAKTETSEVLQPDHSSLIDVGFLLLIYFLVTSTLDPRESDLQMTMPAHGGGGSQLVFDIPVIEIDANGAVSMEQEILDTNPASRELVLLADRLRTYVQAFRLSPGHAEPAVTLEVSDEVNGQRFVDVLNCLAGAGISRVLLDDSFRP